MRSIGNLQLVRPLVHVVCCCLSLLSRSFSLVPCSLCLVSCAFGFQRIQRLAVAAIESTAFGFAQVFFNGRNITARTGFFGVDKPVLFQHKSFFPFQEIIAVITGFIYQFGEFTWRQVLYFIFGMNADAE